ncbi:hypothetical protein ACJMK2_030621 [Sinanodonta woodiana]|uniref:Uncharacterized protein n=1 Tax=Sinanodonta woodiana TaxID=1069815 RepID=A0ABD3WWA6_SINWO
MGLNWAGDPDCSLPFRVVCGKLLAHSVKCKGYTEATLNKYTSRCSSNILTFFEKAINLNKKQTATFKKKFKKSYKAQEADYAAAEIVAKKMKSHTLARTILNS